MRRTALGRMQNPIRGFLHGGAAVASIIGLVLLLRQAWGNGVAVVGAVIFSVAAVAMFSVSSLYHSIPWNRRLKERLQRVDHSMIFLMVAGTVTPIALASLEGPALVASLTFTWTVAIVGILLKIFLPDTRTWLSITLQMAMGWSALVLLPAIIDRLGIGAVILIGLGGLLYTVGMVVFVTKRPRLFPRSFSYHELFHVLVVAAAAMHFLVILNYAIPAIA